MPTPDPTAEDAAELARRANEVAARLKTGSWESVQALALVSIATSLAAMAAAGTSDGAVER